MAHSIRKDTYITPEYGYEKKVERNGGSGENKTAQEGENYKIC